MSLSKETLSAITALGGQETRGTITFSPGLACGAGTLALSEITRWRSLSPKLLYKPQVDNSPDGAIELTLGANPRLEISFPSGYFKDLVIFYFEGGGDAVAAKVAQWGVRSPWEAYNLDGSFFYGEGMATGRTAKLLRRAVGKVQQFVQALTPDNFPFSGESEWRSVFGRFQQCVEVNLSGLSKNKEMSAPEHAEGISVGGQ